MWVIAQRELSPTGSTEPCTGGETCPAPGHAGVSSWEAALQKWAWSPGRHQGEEESAAKKATCILGKKVSKASAALLSPLQRAAAWKTTCWNGSETRESKHWTFPEWIQVLFLQVCTSKFYSKQSQLFVIQWRLRVIICMATAHWSLKCGSGDWMETSLTEELRQLSQAESTRQEQQCKVSITRLLLNAPAAPISFHETSTTVTCTRYRYCFISFQ